jgi:uncharacterized protein YceK
MRHISIAIAALCTGCGGVHSGHDPDGGHDDGMAPCVELAEAEIGWVMEECYQRQWVCCRCACARQQLVIVAVDPCECGEPDLDALRDLRPGDQALCSERLADDGHRAAVLDRLAGHCASSG